MALALNRWEQEFARGVELVGPCDMCEKVHGSLTEQVEAGHVDPEVFPEIQNPRKRAFLIAFAECGIVKRAAAAAGVSRFTVAKHWKPDEQFQAAYDVARELSNGLLLDVARIRAVEGVTRQIGWYKGEAGGEEQEYDHSLLQTLIKGAFPETYRERGGEVTVNLNSIDWGKLSDDQIDRIRRGEHPLSVLGAGAQQLPPGREVSPTGDADAE